MSMAEAAPQLSSAAWIIVLTLGWVFLVKIGKLELSRAQFHCTYESLICLDVVIWRFSDFRDDNRQLTTKQNQLLYPLGIHGHLQLYSHLCVWVKSGYLGVPHQECILQHWWSMLLGCLLWWNQCTFIIKENTQGAADEVKQITTQLL